MRGGARGLAPPSGSAGRQSLAPAGLRHGASAHLDSLREHRPFTCRLRAIQRRMGGVLLWMISQQCLQSRATVHVATDR